MKLCPTCQSEYEDSTATCAEDGATLVDAEALRARQQKAEKLAATTRFVQVTVAEDPFDAEAYAAAIDAAGIPVLSRTRRAGTMDVLVTPGTHQFWEILVPEERVAQAQTAIAARKRELQEEEEGAAKAAEDEEAATEGHEVVGEFEDESAATRWVEQLSGAGVTASLRNHTDVEADSTDARDADRVQVLVPREHVEKARGLLRAVK